MAKTIRSIGLVTVAWALAGTIVLPVNGQRFLTNGLVGYYPFDGNANDESGNGNDGVVQGATLTKDRLGLLSNAYEFSSPGDKITTTNGNGFPVSTNDFTDSLWVNVLSDSTDWQVLLCNGAPDQFQIHIGPLLDSETQIGFQTGGTGAGYTPFISWTLNQWYNVQVVRSQNTNIMIYRDGVLLSQQTSTHGNRAAPEQQSIIFGFRPNPKAQFYGMLDDVRIYNRAFSGSEALRLYAFEATSRLNIKKPVYICANLKVGTSYQLQISSDLNTWTNYGTVFTATNTALHITNDLDAWSRLLFRLKTSP